MDNKEVQLNENNQNVEVNNVQPTVSESPVVEQTPVQQPVQPVQPAPVQTTTPVVEPVAQNAVPEQPVVAQTQEVDGEQAQTQVVEQPASQEQRIELNGSEQVLFEYKKKKDLGVWPFLIFFLFVGGMIIFLPEIQAYLSNYMNNRPTNTNINNNTNNNNPTTPEVETKPGKDEEEKYNALAKDTTLTINSLSLNGFEKTVDKKMHYLNVTIQNKSNTEYNYNENIFIDLYDDNDKFLERILVDSNEAIEATKTATVRLPINNVTYGNAKKLEIKNVKESEYEEVTLQTNEKEQQTLSCNLGSREINYVFANNELLEIDDRFRIEKNTFSTQELFEENLNDYDQKAILYNNLIGVTSSLTKDEEMGIMNIKIDPISLDDEGFKLLNNKIYYKGKTSSKVVSYEMKARGYTCK